jgi:hypothetical protein
MADLQTERDHIRSIFRSACEYWPDVSVTVDGSNVIDIRRASSGLRWSESSALIVVGKNTLNPHLFERCAAYSIRRFLADGWSIKLLDVDFASDCGSGESKEKLRPGELVARALAHTERLRYVLLLTHSRSAINLSDSGDDLVARRSHEPSSPQPLSVPIEHLRLSESAAQDGWIDVFGCYCRPRAEWARELAKALNWPVRTVYPGFSIYFPEEEDHPKAAIPFMRRLSRGRYCAHGWAVWLPGSDRPVRVCEPGETTRRYDARQSLWERFLIATISVGLEPVRDFRKLRRLALARGSSGWSAAWEACRKLIDILRLRARGRVEKGTADPRKRGRQSTTQSSWG